MCRQTCELHDHRCVRDKKHIFPYKFCNLYIEYFQFQMETNNKNEPFLAKRVLKYFSVKKRVREKDLSKSFKILNVVKNIFVSHRRHLTLVIGGHHYLFYRCVKNYDKFFIMMFSNIVTEIRTLFARNGSDYNQQICYWFNWVKE
jgi:hypothetical protein